MKTDAYKTDIYSRIQYRHKLVRLARHAWEAWGEAAEDLQEELSALCPDQGAIAKAACRCLHRQVRFNRLEAQLARTTGMTRASVYNQLAVKWPVCPPLMTLNL